MELDALVSQYENLSNDYANFMFGEIMTEILVKLLVLILLLYFASLALSFLKNI